MPSDVSLMHAGPRGAHAAGVLGSLPGNEGWLPPLSSANEGGSFTGSGRAVIPGLFMTNTVLGPRERGVRFAVNLSKQKKKRRERRLRSPVSGFLNICQI